MLTSLIRYISRLRALDGSQGTENPDVLRRQHRIVGGQRENQYCDNPGLYWNTVEAFFLVLRNIIPGYSDRLGFDVQKIDMGIAACHFHLAAKERDLSGEFRILPAPAIETPENMLYLFSWFAK